MWCVSSSATQTQLLFFLLSAHSAHKTPKKKKKKINSTTFSFALTDQVCAEATCQCAHHSVHSPNFVSHFKMLLALYCIRSNLNNGPLFCLCCHETVNSAAKQYSWTVHLSVISKISPRLEWKTSFTSPAKINTWLKNKWLCIVYYHACLSKG